MKSIICMFEIIYLENSNLLIHFFSKLTSSLIAGCLVFLSWAVLWSIVGEQCLPGGNLFGLIVLFNTSVIFAKLVESIPIPKMPRLPGLLGKQVHHTEIWSLLSVKKSKKYKNSINLTWPWKYCEVRLWRHKNQY